MTNINLVCCQYLSPVILNIIGPKVLTIVSGPDDRVHVSSSWGPGPLSSRHWHRRDAAGSQTRQTRPSSQYRRLIVFELLQNLTHHRSSHFNTMNNEYYELLIHKNSSLDFLLMSIHHPESSFFVTLDSNNIRSTHFLFGENQFRGGTREIKS